MRKPEPITRDEWKKELSRALASAQVSPEGFSRRDLEVAFDLSEQQSGVRLRRLDKLGLIESAGRRRITTISGGECVIPVYRVLKSKKRSGR